MPVHAVVLPTVILLKHLGGHQFSSISFIYHQQSPHGASTWWQWEGKSPLKQEDTYNRTRLRAGQLGFKYQKLASSFTGNMNAFVHIVIYLL